MDKLSPPATPAAAPRSFERDLIAHIPHMRAFAHSLCRDATQADDLAQDAVARAWAARCSFAVGTNMKAWLFRIVRNQFYSEKRRSWRAAELDPEIAAETLVASDDPSAPLRLDEVRRALAMLRWEQREPLILIGAAGLSYEEVSEITGVGVGTIKSRVSRGRARLAELLDGGRLADDGIPAHRAMDQLIAETAIKRSGAGLTLAPP